MSKLKAGDVIEVRGWVMLKHVNPGRYRIKSVSQTNEQDVYDFAKPKGTVTIIRHYAENVDPWVKSADDPDLNGIVKVG